MHAINVRRLVRASATDGERDSPVKATPSAVRLASARVHAEVVNQPRRRAETPLRQLAGEARDGCWIVSEPSASWVDGAERDLAGILAHASDLGSLSDELAAAADTWVRRYHLARERGNIVRPLALHGSRVLEIGAGCGGVTRRIVRWRASWTRWSRRRPGRPRRVCAPATCPPSRSSSG